MFPSVGATPAGELSLPSTNPPLTHRNGCQGGGPRLICGMRVRLILRWSVPSAPPEAMLSGPGWFAETEAADL